MGKRKPAKKANEKELKIKLLISIISLLTAIIGLIDKLIKVLE